MDDALLVHTGRELFEVDRLLDRVSQTGYQLDVDIGFDQGIADLLDHGIEGLGYSVSMLDCVIGRAGRRVPSRPEWHAW